ncbi:BamA/TamA family outer membrane protein [Putridiphycobacter roseus]|uniref:BamA/TamA family outer membrane protein n=1 Tax=Putridiphycobacter roseus TaxID=2219161 RepID=UPI001313DA78|nr:BamA/TamA family outer membrane protein [Putridiphycobacter roseus]
MKKNSFFRAPENATIHFLSQNKKDSIVSLKGSYPDISIEELYTLLKPQPNRKFNLFVYNRIDSLKMNTQIERKKEKINAVNERRMARQNRINKKRNDKSKAKGDRNYFQKVVKLKKEKKGWRNFIATNIGEAPVLMDTVKVLKSKDQIQLFLKNQGFLENEVSVAIRYKEKKKKAYPVYTVVPKTPTRIQKIYFDDRPEYSTLKEEYYQFLKKKDTLIHIGDLLNQDVLDTERARYSKFCRDGAFFDFSKSFIYFEVDTIGRDHLATVTFKIIPRTEELVDGTTTVIPHTTYKIGDVTYVIKNKNKDSFKDYPAYEKKLAGYGLGIVGGRYPLLDTLYYVDSVFKKKFILFGPTDVLVYKGTFIYNEKLPVSPFLIDRQNFLEITDGGDNGWYKEYYVERSYSRLLGLDIFSSITPSVKMDEDESRRLNVKYELTTADKQLFSFEPNATNSNGYLGASISMNYTNKNIFGGAEKLKLSITGGVESQPAVFDKTVDGQQVLNSGRTFNTIEIYPKISLEFPKLIPMGKRLQKTLSKRLYPNTVIDLSYNFQKRSDFVRNLTEFAYSWKFNEAKTKIHQIKWQSFNFIKLQKSEDFAIKLALLNDPYLLNTYSDHFSNKFEYIFTYNNQRIQKEEGKRNYVFGTATFGTSGYLFDVVGVGLNDVENELRQIFGVPFTQFLKMDYDLRYYMNVSKYKSNDKMIAYRLLAGAGYAYGNSPSLPYEESFFAGGSNDIRAWSARTIAPGGTQIWRDTNATTTQISDMRLELNVEYRFQFSDFIKAAIFVDAGNIWKLQDDPENPEDDLSVFGKNFVTQVAMGAGFGLRLDFDFFIVRLDGAIPIHNPYMFAGERWIWEDRTKYKAILNTLPDNYVNSLKIPFSPTLSFGIGYPF